MNYKYLNIKMLKWNNQIKIKKTIKIKSDCINVENIKIKINI